MSGAFLRLRERMPLAALPIAGCGCGDYVVLGLEASIYGRVLYWCLEEDEHFEPLTPSFTEFLGMLRSCQ